MSRWGSSTQRSCECLSDKWGILHQSLPQRPGQWGPNQGCLWWGWGQWERSSRGPTRFSQEEIKLIFVSVSKTWRNSKIKKRKFSSTSIKGLLINPLSFHCYVLSLEGANLISIPIYTWLVKSWNTGGYIVWSSQETGEGHHRGSAPLPACLPHRGWFGQCCLSDRHTLPTAPYKHFWLFPKPSVVIAGSVVSHVGHCLGGVTQQSPNCSYSNIDPW